MGCRDCPAGRGAGSFTAGKRGVTRVLFVFLDGVGLGEADGAVNPVMTARLPTLLGLLGGRRPVRDEAPIHAAGATLVGLDATLGVPGLPQSGTGQVALLTGENAARLFGRHFGPWVPTSLRGLLAERSVLARAVRAGLRVAFANAYPEEFVAAIEKATRGPGPLRAAPPLAALAAGLLTRHTAELARGEAVASEITNDGWRERLGRTTVPVIEPEEAGRNLARIAAAHDLTFFAHYSTDHVGHRGSLADAVAALETVDAFLAGVLAGLPPDTLLVVASDHGNIEDLRGGHTFNPALLLAVGPGHVEFAAGSASLVDVAPRILRWLGVGGEGRPRE